MARVVVASARVFVAAALAAVLLAGSAEAAPRTPGPRWHWRYDLTADEEAGKNVTAWLWEPSGTPILRGLLWATMTGAEVRWLVDPNVRAACQEQGLGILFVYPGGFAGIFDPPVDAAPFESLLANLSALSGRPELPSLPLLPFGHSTSAIGARNLAFYYPNRTLGVVYYKSGHIECPYWADCMGNRTLALHSIPLLAVNGEYEEYGPNGPHPHGESWEIQWLTVRDTLRYLRSLGNLVSLLVDAGAAHLSYHVHVSLFMARWIAKVAAARLPPGPRNDTGPVQLLPLAESSGWLTDSNIKPSIPLPPAPFAAYPGNLSEAYWHIDGELAAHWQAARALIDPGANFSTNLVSFLGQPGRGALPPSVLAPNGSIAGITATSQAGTPVPRYEYAYGSAGQDSWAGFEVALDETNWRGYPPSALGVTAATPGDPSIPARRAELTSFVGLSYSGNSGKGSLPQNVTLAPVADCLDTAAPFTLTAVASSGLPPRFFAVSGPITVDPASGLVTVFPLPEGPAQRMPATVGAYQWGDGTWQTAPPVFTSFVVSRGAPRPVGASDVPVVLSTYVRDPPALGGATNNATFVFVLDDPAAYPLPAVAVGTVGNASWGVPVIQLIGDFQGEGEGEGGGGSDSTATTGRLLFVEPATGAPVSVFALGSRVDDASFRVLGGISYGLLVGSFGALLASFSANFTDTTVLWRVPLPVFPGQNFTMCSSYQPAWIPQPKPQRCRVSLSADGFAVVYAGGAHLYPDPAQPWLHTNAWYLQTLSALNGSLLANVTLTRDHVEDVAIAPAGAAGPGSGPTVFVAGFDNDICPPPNNGPVQMAWLLAYDLSLAQLRWSAWDYPNGTLNCAAYAGDSRIHRLAYRDGPPGEPAGGSLVVLGTTFGGDSIFTAGPHGLDTPPELVAIDEWNSLSGSSAETITYVAILSPANGSLARAQMTVARNPDGRHTITLAPGYGNGIAVSPATGDIFLAETAACCIGPARGNSTVGGRAPGPYAGGDAVLLAPTSPPAGTSPPGRLRAARRAARWLRGTSGARSLATWRARLTR